jgi:hypothetical protein
LRRFHAWVLPLVWLPGALGSLTFYGDEFFAFEAASIPSAVLVYPLIKVCEYFGWTSFIGQRFFPVVVAAGLVLWMTVGWMLDRLRTWRWVYIAIPFAFLLVVKARVAVPGHIPPIVDYPGQEWEWDAVFVAYCWAVYAVALATLLAAAIIRSIGWIIRREPAAIVAHSAH